MTNPHNHYNTELAEGFYRKLKVSYEKLKILNRSNWGLADQLGIGRPDEGHHANHMRPGHRSVVGVGVARNGPLP